MSARTTTPPPPLPSAPGPASAWTDRQTLRAERSRALADLSRHYLDGRRTMLLWLVTGLLGLGWAIAAPGVEYLLEGDLFGTALGGALLLIAVVLMVPSVLALGGAVREDLRTRGVLHGWARLDRDPVARAAWHAPARALFLALPALGVCCTGLVLGAVTAADGTHPVLLGLCGILTACGALGMVKALDYYRLVARELSVPARPAGGAHR
ncbi:hypothetical protein [Streptomyces sp. NPDC018031]|uniref:hypothetical protein n=1 Tax=Streptomyces sp. NPDC018031 TaxID=3365033 RepID=UPI0037A147EA